ncbi:MAG: DUF934 domain-containing protein [Gammaproteobacteria bacterium]|nr:DUF934 domain-containing protein [Gammaproteobacteria bacterium]
MKASTGPEILQAVPGKNFIVPLQFWTLYSEELNDYDGSIAVWIDSDESPEKIADALHSLPLIALNFPVFSDGRSYTNARELRQRYAYKGEIRAIGDVLRDQLYYMAQCGFDSFEIRHDQEAELCLEAFKDFKTGYQSTIAEPTPLFRRR